MKQNTSEDDPFAPTDNESSQHDSAPTHETETDINTGSDDVEDLATIPRPKGLLDPVIGEHFLSWVKHRIEGKAILVNKPEARVHVVKEGVLLVSPEIYKYYVRQMGLLDESIGVTASFKKVQKRVQKLKLHIMAKNRMSG